ncbi:DNA-directed RNA polymerase subunit/transcription factor S like protein [Aduncisulcus paluster]|uniref:DNA-directed RNA polymerase subunit n=1 Tax=Aduncisulcus paluster TaxID=2918883 RepID=A0ABQ5KB18_9EUKA|nr:DNA-directed RNA polymerase subunit/transcription factor S like protein [Aduncisulcus paluster]
MPYSLPKITSDLFESPTAKFCPSCGTLLEIGIDGASCACCGYFCAPKDLGLSSFKTKTSTTFKHEDVLSEIMTEMKQKRAIVEEECPKCGHTKLYFTTMQMRSADEGQTCHYECLKCAHRFSVNN